MMHLTTQACYLQIPGVYIKLQVQMFLCVLDRKLSSFKKASQNWGHNLASNVTACTIMLTKHFVAHVGSLGCWTQSTLPSFICSSKLQDSAFSSLLCSQSNLCAQCYLCVLLISSLLWCRQIPITIRCCDDKYLLQSGVAIACYF